MSKTRDALKTPVYQPRIYGKGTKGRPLPEPFWGLDTERNTEKGKRFNDFVCGWISNERQSFQFSTFTDLLPGTYWVWNLGYDVEALVRDLGVEEGWAMREDGSRFRINEADCVYYKDKRFEWRDTGGKRIFLEASSFFNRIALKDAAKTLCTCQCVSCRSHKKEPRKYQHCGLDEATCPMKDPVDASKMSLSRYELDKAYRDLVNKYCAKDARIAFRLMAFLRQGFKDLGIEIGGTPGSTTKRFLSQIQPFPQVIWQTHRPFLSSYCGGRFEIVRRGVFHDAKQYDIVSAYPWALAKCPMLSPSASHRFTRRMSEEAIYGSYEVRFKTDEYFGLMPGWRGGTRVYSQEESAGYLCKPELEWLHKQGYDYEILRGVEVFDENAWPGWCELVIPLFEKKQGHLATCPKFYGKACNCNQEMKGQPMTLGAKVGVNSMYGILIQLIQKGGVWVPIELAQNPVDFAGVLALEKGPKAFDAGQFYAPVYSSTLTSMVRVKLLETAIASGQENVVAFHTDSILLKDGATMPTRFIGNELGDWQLEKQADELIILKSGQYSIGEVVKGRGFSKRKLNPMDEDEIAVRQKIDLWADRHVRRSRTSVRTAKNWREVSAIETKSVANNIAWELKRDWLRSFSVQDIRKLIDRKEWIDSKALRNVESLGRFGYG